MYYAHKLYINLNIQTNRECENCKIMTHTESERDNAKYSICLESAVAVAAAPVNNTMHSCFKSFVMFVFVHYETWANSKFIVSIGEFRYLYGFLVNGLP